MLWCLRKGCDGCCVLCLYCDISHCKLMKLHEYLYDTPISTSGFIKRFSLHPLLLYVYCSFRFHHNVILYPVSPMYMSTSGLLHVHV